MKREVLKKSIIFRIYSLIIIAILFYIITGSFKQMTYFTILVEAVKTAQYSVFEILWKKYKKKRFNKQER